MDEMMPQDLHSSPVKHGSAPSSSSVLLSPTMDGEGESSSSSEPVVKQSTEPCTSSASDTATTTKTTATPASTSSSYDRRRGRNSTSSRKNSILSTTSTSSTATTSSSSIGRQNSLLLDGIEFDISNLLDTKNDVLFNSTSETTTATTPTIPTKNNSNNNNNTMMKRQASITSHTTAVTAGMWDSMTTSRRSSYQSLMASTSFDHDMSFSGSTSGNGNPFFLSESIRSLESLQPQDELDDEDEEGSGHSDSDSNGYKQQLPEEPFNMVRTEPQQFRHSDPVLPVVSSPPPPSRTIRRSTSSLLPGFSYPSPKDIPHDDQSLELDVNELFRMVPPQSPEKEQQQHQDQQKQKQSGKIRTRPTLSKHLSDSVVNRRKPMKVTIAKPSLVESGHAHDNQPELDRHVSKDISVSSGGSGSSEGQNSRSSQTTVQSKDDSTNSVLTQITKNLSKKTAELKSIASGSDSDSGKDHSPGISPKGEDSFIQDGKVFTLRYVPPPPKQYRQRGWNRRYHIDDSSETRNLSTVQPESSSNSVEDKSEGPKPSQIQQIPSTVHGDELDSDALADNDGEANDRFDESPTSSDQSLTYTTTLRDNSSEDVAYGSYPRRPAVSRSFSYSHRGQFGRTDGMTSLSSTASSSSLSGFPKVYGGGLRPLSSLSGRSRSDEGTISLGQDDEFATDFGNNRRLDHKAWQHPRRATMASPVSSTSFDRTPPSFRRSSWNHYHDRRRNSGSTRRHKVYERKMVEVTPGTFVPLRGSEETWDSIKAGQTVTTTCMSCSARLVCIDSVIMVMCPKCQDIFPTDCTTERTSTNGGGLGLGMEEDEVLLELNRLG